MDISLLHLCRFNKYVRGRFSPNHSNRGYHSLALVKFSRESSQYLVNIQRASAFFAYENKIQASPQTSISVQALILDFGGGSATYNSCRLDGGLFSPFQERCRRCQHRWCALKLGTQRRVLLIWFSLFNQTSDSLRDLLRFSSPCYYSCPLSCFGLRRRDEKKHFTGLDPGGELLRIAHTEIQCKLSVTV